jgi:transcription termination factor NusB
MAKRYHDTNIWEEDWFLSLSPNHMLFWLYVCDKCDHAGILRPNKSLFEKITTLKVDVDQFLDSVNSFDRVRIGVLDNGRWFLTGFIVFQYGKSLNTNNRVHKSIIEQLEKNQVDYKSMCYGLDPFLTSKRDQVDPIDTLKDKDKDKEKNKVLLVIPEYLKDSVEKFKEHRKKLGKKMSPYAVELMIKKLSKLSSDQETQKAIIQQSIDEGWQGVFELKGNNYERSNGKNKQDNGIASEYADI